MESPRRSSDSSPEFEFWVVGNHPQPELLTADELFADGVLLPLQKLSLTHPVTEPAPEPNPLASISSATSPLSGSKRWRDIFKVGDKKASELGINIWPFARSRSAGDGAAATRPRSAAAAAAAVAGRKACSAPCSRSNSRGESSRHARRWAPSPGRSGGVHIGRTGPVWNLPRPAAKGSGPKGKGVRVISLNVNTCIGYRNPVKCRGEEGDKAADSGHVRQGSDGGLFNLRTLFTKKVY